MATTKTKTKSAPSKLRPVLVTTLHRGVFFGYVGPDYKLGDETIKLTDSRNVVMWSRDCKGFMGLPATGPTASCRISPKAPGCELRNVTSVTDCSEAATVEFEKGYWA
jgi:hypothetical protein